MKIFVTAKPSAPEDKVQKVDGVHFVVWVKAPPFKGKANASIRKVLAEYFKTTLDSVVIISGHFTKTKVIEIINIK